MVSRYVAERYPQSVPNHTGGRPSRGRQPPDRSRSYSNQEPRQYPIPAGRFRGRQATAGWTDRPTWAACERPGVVPEAPAEFYSRTAERFAVRNDRESLPEPFVAFIDRFLDHVDGDRIVDVGCGTGRETGHFVRQGYEAIGVDVAAGMIDHASATEPGDYCRMDAAGLGIADDAADAVWCNAVLVCFEPAAMGEVVDELVRVLAPGGVVQIGLKLGSGEFVRETDRRSVRQHLIGEDRARRLLTDRGVDVVHDAVFDPRPEAPYRFYDVIGRLGG
ncbi:hypothetical protein BRD17_09585 [Halobacteriales archaeon SW_7_68_16]|nr:MAG: hypothetical protein BRD17_09585 [Halobacteriales archaeon SW_7_68_16]